MAEQPSNRYTRDIPLPGLEDGRSGYRAPHVSAIVGISYRQLDYWTTTGLVHASVRDAAGSGTQRLYGFSDIVELKVIKSLLDTGVSLQKIRAAIEYVRERGLDLRDVTLLSDGTRVYALDDQQAIVDVINGGQGVFAIAVQPLYRELEAQVVALPAERAEPPVSRGAARRAPGARKAREAAGL